MKDSLGDRMKGYEAQTCSISMIPGLPVVARLDGRSFSTFTKGLKRPYDERLSRLMVETTKMLVERTNANCGYTQSDEITLTWFNEDPQSETYFGGRFFKIVGDLSATASVFFNRHLAEFLPEKADKAPTFDCRVYNVPNLDEVANSFLWRELDASKNSISMAAQHYFSHNELHKKTGKEKQEMLFSKGVNWNDYPAFFKRGTYVQRKREMTKFSATELAALPALHEARKNPNLEVERWVVRAVDLPKLNSVANRVDVIIHGKDPILTLQ